MKSGLSDYVQSIKRRGDSTRPCARSASQLLEVHIERAWQGTRRCRLCASVNGSFECLPSAAVVSEWRYSREGVELLVHLRTCDWEGGPRLQAMIRVEKVAQLHARAVYSCPVPRDSNWELPLTAKLISETSQCDFVFPEQVEIVASGKLSTARRLSLSSTLFRRTLQRLHGVRLRPPRQAFVVLAVAPVFSRSGF